MARLTVVCVQVRIFQDGNVHIEVLRLAWYRIIELRSLLRQAVGHRRNIGIIKVRELGKSCRISSFDKVGCVTTRSARRIFFDILRLLAEGIHPWMSLVFGWNWTGLVRELLWCTDSGATRRFLLSKGKSLLVFHRDVLADKG